MDVRTYRGREMSEVMARIREDLGDDALILKTHQGRAQVEVSVGIGGTEPESRVPRAGTGQKRLLSDPVATHTNLIRLEESVNEDLPALLALQGVRPEVSNKIISACEQSSVKSQSLDKLLSEGLSRVVKFDSALTGSQRIVALIGSTGVGKTTTIAKLAARMRMSFDLKIGLISADSFRVGAGVHLQAYAQMLGVPCKTIQGGSDEGKQLRTFLAEYRHMDLVLIDTAGCSPREVARIQAMQKALQGMRQIEKILCLPAPSNDVDLRVAMAAFKPLDYSRLIISKLDESGYLGPVLSTAVSSMKPLAFLTTGQRVPEDIEPASARRIGWMLARTIH